MIYRITFGFSGMGVGWSETHAMLSALPNPIDLMPTLADIATKRVQFLGREFSIIAIRASRYATDGGLRTRGSNILKRVFTNSVTTKSAAAEPSAVALICRGAAQTSQIPTPFDSNSNQTFLGAPLDVSVDNAGVVDPGAGGLGAAFAAWRTAMLNTSIGWLASDTILNTGLDAIAQAASGRVTLTTHDNSVGPLVLGQFYKALIRSVNSGHSPLNGQVIVQATGAKELTTKEIIGIPTAQSGGFIRVYRQVQPFVDYGDLTLNGIVGKHKRGRPFGSTPGRARARIRG